MRKPILAGGRGVDMAQVEQKVQEILDYFEAYLEGSPFRFGKSRHEVMGPIPKILHRAFSGKWSLESLAGYAYRIHEMKLKHSRNIPEEVRQNLENGISKVLELYELLPPEMVQKIRERIDYSLYYRRRKKQSKDFDQTCEDFGAFLRQKYPTLEELRRAWGDESIKDYKMFPTKKKAKNPVYQSDVDEFLSSHREGRKIEEIDIEIDEEEVS